MACLPQFYSEKLIFKMVVKKKMLIIFFNINPRQVGFFSFSCCSINNGLLQSNQQKEIFNLEDGIRHFHLF